MNKIRLATMDAEGGMHLGPREYVPFTYVDGSILECAANAEDQVGFMCAIRYLDIIIRRLADVAGVGEDIAAEVLRNGAHRGEDVSLYLSADCLSVDIHRGETGPIVCMPLHAVATLEAKLKELADAEEAGIIIPSDDSEIEIVDMATGEAVVADSATTEAAEESTE